MTSPLKAIHEIGKRALDKSLKDRGAYVTLLREIVSNSDIPAGRRKLAASYLVKMMSLAEIKASCRNEA
jgi:hypothetical protein